MEFGRPSRAGAAKKAVEKEWRNGVSTTEKRFGAKLVVKKKLVVLMCRNGQKRAEMCITCGLRRNHWRTFRILVTYLFH